MQTRCFEVLASALGMRRHRSTLVLTSMPRLPAVLAFTLPLCACVIDASDDADDAVASATDNSDTRDPSGDSTSNGSTSDDPTGDSSISGPGSSSSSSASTSAESTDTRGDDGSTSAGTTGESGGEPGGGTIDVTLSGCEVDLDGTVVVTYNGSLGVASVYDNGATLSGSFQFDLEGTGVMQLSSQHRVDTGNVVNLVDVAQGTWTNLDSDALAGDPDTIGGTLTVNAWDPASGISDLQLDEVSLLNVDNDNVCTVSGTIVTTQLYP